MLNPRILSMLCAAALLLCAAPGADAKKKKDPGPKDVHLPARLTAGDSNQMMASLSPDGETL